MYAIICFCVYVLGCCLFVFIALVVAGHMLYVLLLDCFKCCVCCDSIHADLYILCVFVYMVLVLYLSVFVLLCLMCGVIVYNVVVVVVVLLCNIQCICLYIRSMVCVCLFVFVGCFFCV